MELGKALEPEIRDHFQNLLGEDEEIHFRHYIDGAVMVEISVAWYDFLLKLVVYFKDGGVGFYRVDGLDQREPLFFQDLAYPTAIEELLVAMGEEWDKYLGRSKQN